MEAKMVSKDLQVCYGKLLWQVTIITVTMATITMVITLESVTMIRIAFSRHPLETVPHSEVDCVSSVDGKIVITKPLQEYTTAEMKSCQSATCQLYGQVSITLVME